MGTGSGGFADVGAMALSATCSRRAFSPSRMRSDSTKGEKPSASKLNVCWPGSTAIALPSSCVVRTAPSIFTRTAVRSVPPAPRTANTTVGSTFWKPFSCSVQSSRTGPGQLLEMHTVDLALASRSLPAAREA